MIVLLTKNLIGPCKCLTQDIDFSCPCGVLNVSDDDFGPECMIYLSCFEHIIKTRAQNGSLLEQSVLSNGIKVIYNF